MQRYVLTHARYSELRTFIWLNCTRINHQIKYDIFHCRSMVALSLSFRISTMAPYWQIENTNKIMRFPGRISIYTFRLICVRCACVWVFCMWNTNSLCYCYGIRIRHHHCVWRVKALTSTRTTTMLAAAPQSRTKKNRKFEYHALDNIVYRK